MMLGRKASEGCVMGEIKIAGDVAWFMAALFIAYENAVFNAGFFKPVTGMSIPHLMLSAAVLGWPIWRVYA
jgi:hypothetical protein